MPVQTTDISITVKTILPQSSEKSKRKLKNILERLLQTEEKCGILSSSVYACAGKEQLMAEMTKMQQKIYDYIVQMLTEEGFAPSVREIGAAVGLKSPSTVHFHLKNMEERGIIKRSGRKGRTITLVRPAKAAAPVQVQEAEPPVGRVPIVGSVAAGTPILAQECIEDYHTQTDETSTEQGRTAGIE